MLDLKNITRLFTADAKFQYKNGLAHYKKRQARKDIPQNMTRKEYFDKSERLSLKDLNGKTVRAYKVGSDNRTVKYADGWILVYAGGKNGRLISAYPVSGIGRFLSLMKRDNGVELEKE